MHRVVAWVFKFIGISIMLMILMDTGIMLADAFTTNGRIQAQANLMQMEIAKNNYLSDEAANAFVGTSSSGSTVGTGFKRIVELSKVYKEIKFNSGAVTGSVSEVKNYGDYHVLKITATINPWHYYFSGHVNGGIRKIAKESTIVYTFTIPCLRYMK